MNWRYIGFSSIFLAAHLVVWLITFSIPEPRTPSDRTISNALTAETYFATGRPLPLHCLSPYSVSLLPNVSFRIKRTLVSKRLSWSSKLGASHKPSFPVWLESIKGVGAKTASGLQKYISPKRGAPCPPYFEAYRAKN